MMLASLTRADWALLAAGLQTLHYTADECLNCAALSASLASQRCKSPCGARMSAALQQNLLYLNMLGECKVLDECRSAAIAV